MFKLLPSTSQTLHIAHIPRLIAQRRASAVLGTIIIAMLWGGIAFKYLEDRQQDYRDAARTNQNFAMVFVENVLRSIGEIDKAVLYLRRSVETRKGSTDYSTIVDTTDVLSEIIVQVAIVDAAGVIRATNAKPEPRFPIDVSDREHIRIHMSGTDDRLYISKPVVGRASGKWSVQVARRFQSNDGSFAGVVVASLDPGHFTAFYDKIDLGATRAVALIGEDGVVRSSGGSAVGRPKLGQDLAATTLFKHIQRDGDAAFESMETAAGEVLLVTARKVRGYPLWVTVSTKESEIYRESWSSLRLNGLIGLALTLLILAAMEQILRTEAKAKVKAEQLHLTLEHMSQGIMLVTGDRHIPIINRRCGELLDLPTTMIENPPRFDQLAEYQAQRGDFHSPATSALLTPLDHDRSSHPSEDSTVLEYQKPDGIVIEVCNAPLPDGGFVQTFTDITKRREAEAHVARLASEDPLTGLPNRRVFRAALQKICSRPCPDETGETIDFAVLFLDLDRFKVVNDTLGHRVGDMLLKEVAKRLKASLRPTDILARLGGDEFAVVVPDIESRAAIEALTSGIVETVAEPYVIDGHRIRSSASIGIAVGPPDGTNADELLMAADLALYAVKSDRRGTYRFHQKSMNEEVNNRRQIELDLREAIERGQLQLHYHPVIDLRRNVVSGFEALARWNHPVKGMVPPGVFIPVAEDCGLILPLGNWALTEACRAAAQWPGDLRIAVNLSPVQLSSPDLADAIQQILAETALRPDRLELEITERIFVEDNEKTLSTLHRLKGLGIRISMDDFGTGYSSLSYLRSFPFDTIKVDRAFVSDLGEDTENSVIVQAVIIIAGALGMTTIAEGVETAHQQQILKVLGCDEVQGDLFSRPVPIEKVQDIIAQWTGKKTMAA
jgi:diguanylate cyclase (GGDEF)-like protein